METELLQPIIIDLPFTSVKIQIYLLPFIFTLFFIPASILLFLKLERKRPFYLFSRADYLSKLSKDQLFNIEDRLAFMRLLTTVLFSLSLMCPSLLTMENRSDQMDHHELPPKEGSALFLLLDSSGSIGRTISVDSFRKMRLIDYLKELSKEFITSIDQDNPPQRKDLIGLVSVSRNAYVIVPPTFEHDVLLQAIDRFDVIKSKEGEGTSLSYAIYKTAHLIEFLQQKAREGTRFNLDSSAIILITDGVETVNPEDVNKPYVSISMNRAAAFAAEHQIPLYLIIIFPELKSDAYRAQRNQLEKAAAITHGGLYIVNDPKEVGPVLKKIEGLKKSQLGFQAAVALSLVSVPLWPYLLWAGWVLFLICIYLQFYHYRMAP